MVQHVIKLIITGVVFLSATIFASAQADSELPQYAEEQHLGVASCASGTCHGSVNTRKGTAIAQNEYVIWSKRDRHRIAYQTLLTAESKQIARKLGLKNAHEAKMCLDCHADNVALNQRGKKFQLDDGIGCEACHGGAEKYISIHIDRHASRAETLQAGLYPTDDPHARARLCLSCHMGTAKKMASHDIMGAGHPRVTFELDSFGVLQPAHYVVDADYSEAKWHGSSVELWSIGQLESARQTLHLIRDRLKSRGLFPELALFDCHACHHSMADKKWAASDRSDLPPGSVRLNDANFVMLIAIAGVVDPGKGRQIKAALKQLHTSVANGDDVAKGINRLMKLINAVDGKLESQDLGAMSSKLAASVVRLAASGKLKDYVSAEQAVLAIDMLLGVTSDRSRYARWLDTVYKTLEDENNFEPARFIRTMKKYAG